ncbi:MAG: tetratricopeptide repeat protein [Bauldia sp.]|nr:tetratricopeptide repeat protein [Bauldia sp.]
MQRAPRKLTVLASLDVAGYSRLVEREERRTLGDLAQIRRRILRPTVARYSGDLFKTMGDGALIEFPSVEDAVEWSVAFQTGMAAFNEGRADDTILVRVGIALADVFVQGQDRFGAAVGFVTRLQESAPAGGISITHSVRWQLTRELAGQFNSTEWVAFKGRNEELFEIWIWTPDNPAAPDEPLPTGYGHMRRQDAAAPAPSDPAGGGPAPPDAWVTDEPSIVVLPFDNMSGDPAADPLIDGIIEEITAALSRVRDFVVIARNSAYAYKGRAVDIREIARELGVHYVLEGSLRKSGDRVRVTAQLIDAASGVHIWADRFDGVIADIFAFEDEIATKVTGALRPSIWDAEIAHARRKRPESQDAYDLVLRALPHLWAHRRKDNAEAIRLLDEAMRLDPDYARAKAIAAWARAQHAVYNWSDDLNAIRAEGDRLIADAAPVIGDDPTALTALATATMLLFGDLDRARAFVDRALALDPNNAWAWTRRGFLEAYQGDPQLARASFEKAIELSPLDPFSFNGCIGIGFSCFAAGNPEEAVKWARRALGEKVGMTWAYRDLAVFLASAGDIAGAREALARFTAERPGITIAQIGDAMKFVQPRILGMYLEGLRLAGLPE